MSLAGGTPCFLPPGESRNQDKIGLPAKPDLSFFGLPVARPWNVPRCDERGYERIRAFLTVVFKPVSRIDLGREFGR
jgi:hypothetical protein